MADKIKLLVAIALLLGAIVAFYYFADYSKLVRVLGLLATLGVAVVIALQTEVGRAGWGFAIESRNEMRRVVWPTRKETTQTTLVVFVVVIIVAIVLWLLDMVLLGSVQWLTHSGG
ncbi:MAG: preprotein translocase subunit SecE [Gammaproteobacteria bacterium]